VTIRVRAGGISPFISDAGAAAGFYGSNVIELCQPRGGYNSVGLGKVGDDARKKSGALMPSIRLQPIAFARAHHCAAATHLRARVDATSMAEAELQSTLGARPTIVARGCAIGVNAESAK
jgi:hypothetical protein